MKWIPKTDYYNPRLRTTPRGLSLKKASVTRLRANKLTAGLIGINSASKAKKLAEALERSVQLSDKKRNAVTLPKLQFMNGTRHGISITTNNNIR